MEARKSSFSVECRECRVILGKENICGRNIQVPSNTVIPVETSALPRLNWSLVNKRTLSLTPHIHEFRFTGGAVYSQWFMKTHGSRPISLHVSPIERIRLPLFALFYNRHFPSSHISGYHFTACHDIRRDVYNLECTQKYLRSPPRYRARYSRWQNLEIIFNCVYRQPVYTIYLCVYLWKWIVGRRVISERQCINVSRRGKIWKENRGKGMDRREEKDT